jgi:hypothetical protein
MKYLGPALCLEPQSDVFLRVSGLGANIGTSTGTLLQKYLGKHYVNCGHPPIGDTGILNYQRLFA